MPSGSASIHRPPNPWRGRDLGRRLTVALAIGLLLTPGFPERLVLDVASSTASRMGDREPDDTSPLFIYFLNPIKDARQRAAGRDDERPEPDDVRGRDRRRAPLAGVLAGLALAIVAAVGFS